MKKNVLVLTGGLCLSAVMGVYAQGITFTTGLSWKQVLEKAKKEQKLVFVDCYTTWCGPCKQMDREVYPNDSTGAVVNKNFVSIKVQMDSSTNDTRDIKSWYGEARRMQQEHKVNAYPSYLIFSPAGDIVFREAGAKRTVRFVKVMQTAADTGKVYATQLSAWKAGKKDFNAVPAMIRKAEAAGDNTTATQLARECIEKYIPRLSGSALYNPELLIAVGRYVQPGDKKIFSLFYPQEAGVKTDSLINRPGASATIAAWVIEKDIRSMLVKNNNYTQPRTSNPDWEKIEQTFAKKYDAENADRLVNDAKQNWYRITEPDWHKLAEAQLYSMNKQLNANRVSRMGINNTIWNDIFFHVTDTILLADAANIMKRITADEEKATGKPEAGYVDTYANLLFKLGRNKEAIELQQKLVAMRPDVVVFKETLAKMKKGEPTWLTPY